VGVITTFINAYTAFNKWDLITLGGLIADDAVLYCINSGAAWSGKPYILEYLKGKFATDKPICALVSIELHPPGLPTTVRGVANWSYTGLPNPTTFSINYEFRIHPSTHLINWMWARPV
jgi:hypothetical protein